MGTPIKQAPLKICQACGKQMIRRRINQRLEDLAVFVRRVYCNRKCMANGMIQNRLKSASGSRRKAHQQLKPNCEICGSTKERHVHHIDHDPLNNEMTNLQTLCRSCHMRAHSPNYTGTALQQKQCALCSRPSVKKGLCWTHNTRQQRYGSPLLKKIKIGSEWHLTQVDG